MPREGCQTMYLKGREGPQARSSKVERTRQKLLHTGPLCVRELTRSHGRISSRERLQKPSKVPKPVRRPLP